MLIVLISLLLPYALQAADTRLNSPIRNPDEHAPLNVLRMANSSPHLSSEENVIMEEDNEQEVLRKAIFAAELAELEKQEKEHCNDLMCKTAVLCLVGGIFGTVIFPKITALTVVQSGVAGACMGIGYPSTVGFYNAHLDQMKRTELIEVKKKHQEGMLQILEMTEEEQ